MNGTIKNRKTVASQIHNGYGLEDVNAAMNYGFEKLKLKRICANMPVDHLSSRRVAEKLGMTLERYFVNKLKKTELFKMPSWREKLWKHL